MFPLTENTGSAESPARDDRKRKRKYRNSYSAPLKYSRKSVGGGDDTNEADDVDTIATYYHENYLEFLKELLHFHKFPSSSTINMFLINKLVEELDLEEQEDLKHLRKLVKKDSSAIVARFSTLRRYLLFICIFFAFTLHIFCLYDTFIRHFVRSGKCSVLKKAFVEAFTSMSKVPKLEEIQSNSASANELRTAVQEFENENGEWHTHAVRYVYIMKKELVELPQVVDYEFHHQQIES